MPTSDAVQSASSYDCDGCGHHASFHTMENKSDAEIHKRWELEAKEKECQDRIIAERPYKRARQIGYRNGMTEDGLVNSGEISDGTVQGSEAGAGKKTAKRAAMSRSGAGKSTRSKGRVTEILDNENDDDMIELD
jgi:hypothetical protein